MECAKEKPKTKQTKKNAKKILAEDSLKPTTTETKISISESSRDEIQDPNKGLFTIASRQDVQITEEQNLSMRIKDFKENVELQLELNKDACHLLQNEIDCLDSKEDESNKTSEEIYPSGQVEEKRKSEDTVTVPLLNFEENEKPSNLQIAQCENEIATTSSKVEIRQNQSSTVVLASEDFRKLLEKNKEILKTTNEICENQMTISQVKVAENVDIRPYTEGQLASLYTNGELEAADRFTVEFVEAELRGTVLKQHPLNELLENYLSIRHKVIGNMLEIEQLRKEYKELQNSLWNLEPATITGRAECLDGNIVMASHTYNRAIFHRSTFQTICRIMNSIRKLVTEYHMLYSYSTEVLKLQIDIYLQTLISNCISFARLPKNAPTVLATELPPPHLIPLLNELRLCISILFSFQRRLIKDSVFIDETRSWLTQAVALLLRFANWQDHMFLLHHLLRCPAGVGSWAAYFIQAPLTRQTETMAFADLEVNHIISILAVLFQTVDKREQFLEQFSQCDDTSGENLWILVDSEGEEDEDCSLPALRENDLVQIMNQLPLDNLFRKILYIETKNDKDYYSYNKIDEHHILRFFAFATTLLRIINKGLQTYGQPRYNQFAKRLCRFMRHIVQYGTDQWEQFQKSQNLEDAAMLQRLQVEYDAFFLRATHYLFASQKLGAWQFLAVVPYHMVSIKTLWRLFYLLHNCDMEEKLILDPTDTTDFQQKLWDESLRIEFEEKLGKMSEAESYYLLNTFANMALARKEDDMIFIQAAVLDLLEVGFISEATRDLCSKNARILLTYVTSKYPQFLSDILSKVSRNMQNMASMSLYLYEELPLSIWQLRDADIELMSKWLIHSPFLSEENRLARMILSRLNWDFTDSGTLFLPYSMHCKVALLIVQAIDKDENCLLWAWKIILKLRLHFSDKGFSDLVNIPDIESVDVVYKGIREQKPFASLLSLLMTNWGHLIPLVCTKGLLQLQTLQTNQQHVAVIFVLYLIVPLFIECQESLINSEHFQDVLIGLLNADRSYVNMAKSLVTPHYPILEHFGNMIQTHITDYRRYGLSSPRCMVRLWMNSLVSVPGWNKDYGVLYLLDCIIKSVFFQIDALEAATSILKDLLQASTPQEQTGSISSIFKWASLSNAPQGSLLTSSSLPNCTFLAYLLISIEHEEREKATGLWKEILVQLWLQKGKVNVDAAIKKAASVIKVSSFTSSSLCIYRWAQQALDTPVDHPLLPILWQNFFTLYLTRIPAIGISERVCVGEKFFQGVINFSYFKKIKKRLQETIDHYKREIEELNNKDDEKHRHLFYENCLSMFKAFSLWLEEPRLQENNLHLQALPPQYASRYLALVLQGSNVPWVEFINQEEMQCCQEKAVRSWKRAIYRENINYNNPKSNTRGTIESDDPVERILRRLNSYDTPKQAPDIVVSTPLIPTIDLENREKMFKFLEPYFRTLQQFAHNYMLKISEYKALDSNYKELVPQLYRSMLNKVKKQVACKGSSNGTRCTGPALITLEMQEARINERLDHQIQSNRNEYESILNKYLQEPAQSLCLSSVIVQKTIEVLQLRLKANPEAAELGVELFYHVLSLIGEETNAYVPARHFITTCLEKLGKTHILGVDYECPRLLNKIFDQPSLSGVLVPYFSPINSSTANFLHMYSAIVDKMERNKDIIFAILSKFDISHWLTTKHPKISQRAQFIELTLKALTNLGQEPSKDLEMLHEVFRKHLLCILEYQFPEHYGDVLMLTLKASNPGADSGCIAVSVWMDILNFLAKPIKLKATGPIRDQLRQYAQQQYLLNYQELSDTVNLLTKHFSKERLQYGLYGLYPKYRSYIDVFVLFLGMIAHALIINAMNAHLGLLGDKLCEILWPQLRDMFAPWIVPYWMQNIKDNMPTWMQQLTDDRAVLLPWIPADGPYAQKVIHMLFESVQFIIHTLPACNIILGFVWQWYVTNFAHPAVKDHVLNLVHASFLALPWCNYWPSVGELELMLKIVDQYLPECHVFLGYVFIEVNWSSWINVLVTNSPVQISMRVHQCLLNLIVKISNEPHLRNNQSEKIRKLLVHAESFNWDIIEPYVLQQVMDWYVMSCNPLVLFSQDPMDLDFTVLRFLKAVSRYQEPLKTNTSNLLQKRHIFVRSYVKLLSVLVSRHKSLTNTKRNNFKTIIAMQLNHLEAVVGDDLEMSVLLRELFGLFTIESLKDIIVTCFEQWLASKPSNSIILKVVLQEAGSSINDNQIVALLYETCLNSLFNNNVNQNSGVSWNCIVSYVKPFGPKQTELESILVQQGKVLTLYVLIYQKISTPIDRSLLLNTLLQWLTDIKITSYTEDKLPLIWSQILLLCIKHAKINESETSIILQKFSQILVQLSAEKGISGWGKGFLGAIGIVRGETASLKFKFLCKAVAAFVLAQLPDGKDNVPVIRKDAGASGAVGHFGGNKECGKLLYNLEMGQSQGEIKSCAEIALKQIQDASNSLENSRAFLANLVTRLYTKPYLKDIEC